MEEQLKLFISYCHEDLGSVQFFLKHTQKLQDDKAIDVWWDKNITAGDDFWKQIDEHLKDRDIVCLFISANYLASKACKEEMNRAITMRRKNGVTVFPIILSPCAWTDYEELKILLATPTDGKPISSFEDENAGWLDVYNHLKKVTSEKIKIKSVIFTSEFSKKLKDATLLTKAHPNKKDVCLDDIFVFPDFTIIDKTKKSKEKIVSSRDIFSDFSLGEKLVIEGEDQSGKTSLAFRLVTSLRERNYLPVYIHDEESLLQGNFENRIAKSFAEEYDTEYALEDFGKTNIIPIIDDFYKAKKPERVLEALSTYKSSIIIVDGIFRLNFEEEKLLIGYKACHIRELKPSLRNELIRKWVRLSNEYNEGFVNEEYRKLDENTEWVDNALGKTIGKGIMPAYPFFILSVISTYETFVKPLDKDITSQGYCYQALIYFFLRKYGVSNDDVDTYVNFLTEFAYRIYILHSELTEDEFGAFINEYSQEFNLTEKKETLVKRLLQAKIIRISSCRNYSFEYPYLYYFFAGKYFAEHSDGNYEENSEIISEIDNIIGNLHTNENAYIAIFLMHHSKSHSLQQKLTDNAQRLFKSFSPATLETKEMAFFSNKELFAKNLIEQANIEANDPNKTRQERLVREDEIAEREGAEEESEKEPETELATELRRSIKTVEVMGHVIKNRAGSLKQTELVCLFREAMYVHLRLLSSFFEIIKAVQKQPKTLDFLTERIENSYSQNGVILDHDKAVELTPVIFWNMNFMTTFCIIRKIGMSLGSNKLTNIISQVCDEINTPVSFIVKHQILMWYSKNLQINKMAEMNRQDFSEIAKNIMKLFIVEHCQMHQIDSPDRNKISQLLGLKKQHLLPKPTHK